MSAQDCDSEIASNEDPSSPERAVKQARVSPELDFESTDISTSGEGVHKKYRGRIAPSPSGHLHLGHAQTFWIAMERARRRGGELVLRIEDLDRPRCKTQYYTDMIEDLQWFGVHWTHGPGVENVFDCLCHGVGPYLQSQRRELYMHAWRALRLGGYIYPSPHSRKDVERAITAPHEGDEEIIFPTSLRPSDMVDKMAASTDFSPIDKSTYDSMQPGAVNWRFRVPDGEAVCFTDLHMGPQVYIAGKDFGDFVVWRSDGIPSYELAVVVDDATMGITEVVRGGDLILSTARQLLLYKALQHMWNRMIHTLSSDQNPGVLSTTTSSDTTSGSDYINCIINCHHTFDPPAFFHCPLVRDAAGKRMAKRDGSTTLRGLRMGAHCMVSSDSSSSSNNRSGGRSKVIDSCNVSRHDDVELPNAITPADLMEKYFDVSMLML